MNEITRVLKVELPGGIIEVAIHSENEFMHYSQKWQITNPLQVLTISSYTPITEEKRKSYPDYMFRASQFKNYPTVIWANLPK